MALIPIVSELGTWISTLLWWEEGKWRLLQNEISFAQESCSSYGESSPPWILPWPLYWSDLNYLEGLIAPRFFFLSLGFLCLRSDNALPFLLGIFILGIVHHTITVKGSHLASHNALTESKSWGKAWAIFFLEVCNQCWRMLLCVRLYRRYSDFMVLGDYKNRDS